MLYHDKCWYASSLPHEVFLEQLKSQHPLTFFIHMKDIDSIHFLKRKITMSRPRIFEVERYLSFAIENNALYSFYTLLKVGTFVLR